VTATLLALVAALSWGTSDFLGGLQARSIRLALVLAVSMIAGSVTIGCVFVVARPDAAFGGWLVPAVAAGPASVLALALIYRAMAVGPVYVVAPVAAAGALVPVAWAWMHGQPLSTVTALAVVCALVGVTLSGWPAEPAATGAGQRRFRATMLAGAAALAIGCFLVLLGTAAESSPLGAALVMRLSAMVVSLLWVLAVARPRAAVRELSIAGRSAVLLLVAIGVTDIVAETAYALATHGGNLGIVAVIASLYPAMTVILARIFLAERAGRSQRVGAVLAIAGLAVLSGVR
jgi:uncharacterized membrane protein